MKALVIYDSAYGNTAKIAAVVRDALEAFGPAKLLPVHDVEQSDLERFDLLVIGSPTQGGMATKPIQEFIRKLQPDVLANVKIAVFDTRFEPAEQGGFVRLLMKVIGYAAPKMARAIERKGGSVIAGPEGFIVHDKDGPLKNGELERAIEWAEGAVEHLTHQSAKIPG